MLSCHWRISNHQKHGKYYLLLLPYTHMIIHISLRDVFYNIPRSNCKLLISNCFYMSFKYESNVCFIFFCLIIKLFSGFTLGKLFGFKFPGLRVLTYRKQSLPQEDPDVVVVDSSKHSDDSVAMKHFKSPTKESCSPSEADDTKALIQPSRCSPLVNISGPLDHSSPKRQWDRLYPDMLQSSSQLTHSRSKESICSIRRASSVHDIEGFNVHPKNIFRDRHASEGMFAVFFKMKT